MKRRTALALLVPVALTLTACGGTSPSTEEGALDADSVANAAEGSITFCPQKDGAGAFVMLADAYNEANADTGFRVDVLELPESVDEQRNQILQRAQAKSPECDVYGADVTWTAEFVSQGWIEDVSAYLDTREDEFIPSTLESARYQDKYWAVPLGTNVGFLYYRSDQFDAAPTSWQDVYAMGAESAGYAFQGAAYEGLTVDFLEVAYAAGGSVLSEDGSEAVIDSPENLAALTLMVDGVRRGAALAAVPTFMEEDTRRAFEAEEASLSRNWTYQYVLGQDSVVAGKFDIIPLPPFEGGSKGGVLGGVNLAISTFSDNKSAALRFIDFATSAESAVGLAIVGTPPCIASAYDDPRVQEALPFWEVLYAGIEQGGSRPVSPVYPQISQAIYRNVNAALAGTVSPADALATAQEQITEALDSF